MSGRLADVGEHRLEDQPGHALVQLLHDLEKMQLGVIDERQHLGAAVGQLARELRAHRAAGAGDEQPPAGVAAAVGGAEQVPHRPIEQALELRVRERASHGVTLPPGSSARAVASFSSTRSTRRLRARPSGVSFEARGLNSA